MTKAHFGLVGLGVMGENLVLNAERNGFSSVVVVSIIVMVVFISGVGVGVNGVAANGNGVVAAFFFAGVAAFALFPFLACFLPRLPPLFFLLGIFFELG